MEVKLKDRDFWYSLHGQVPGMLEWDMGNEFFLRCTTDQCSFAEQNLAKYKMQLIKPPTLPQEKKPNSNDDGPTIEPNLWMWVNPNLVCPAMHKAPNPSHTFPPSAPWPKTDESDCLENNKVVHHTEQCQQQNLPVITRDTDFIEKKIKEECTSSKKNTKKHTLNHGLHQKKDSWTRPPLNYSHVVALALKNGPSCGLRVQQIYNFTQQHFPYFQKAPEGWKNTICHNLYSLAYFDKLPLDLEDDMGRKSHSFLWKLTDEGHRFFQEETRVLASVRKKSIKQCMCRPELLDILFHL
ncbi:forkhead box protein R2 [Acomys russatus]|uniref:forkhead box protein R2 n=1 Tax=Acomys russatus TaxID=60746 RepID=UPI0021E293F9|nr:forkhead box protein R2 [Acomys russatus]